MKEKLTNKEIARVFAMYYGCKYRYENVMYVDGVVTGETVIEVLGYGDEYHNLLLTSLSEISDEDARVLVSLVYPDAKHDDAHNLLLGRSLVTRLINGYIGNREAIVFQYLISKGYAGPLFFAPNHPCNGKTAIELGLAISSTTNK